MQLLGYDMYRKLGSTRALQSLGNEPVLESVSQPGLSQHLADPELTRVVLAWLIVPDWNYETKSGPYIYAGEPAGFHEWEFRTIVCMKFTNQKIEKKMAELKDQEQAWIIITREGSGTWA